MVNYIQSLLFDVLYYALPIVASYYIYKLIAPKFSHKPGHINIMLALVMVVVVSLMFVISTFIFATASFFALRG